MRNLLLILQREFVLRIKKPSFWILTLLVPIILAILYAMPVVAAQHDEEPTMIMVVDDTGLFEGGLISDNDVHFRSMPNLEFARKKAGKDGVVLFIPMRETTIPTEAFLYYDGKIPPLKVQSLVDARLQTLLRNALFEDVYGLNPTAYHSVESTHIRLHTQDAATGHESFAQLKNIVAIVLAVLMVLALIVFGVQVMRAVQEERQNRIAEILVSSIRPVYLMAGKIAGIALTACLQLALWIILTATAINGIQASAPELFAQVREQKQKRRIATKGEAATVQYNETVALVDETVQGLTAINLGLVATMFFAFFLIGYLLYGALLAALAPLLDSEADAMQWALLIGSPLLLVLILAKMILSAPAGALATWLSIMPFTAPAAMMLRIPFGIASWQVILSIVLLIAAFVAAAFIAARNYRHHIVE